MKKQENIAKRGPVIWAQYELKLDQLDILFKFVLHAFLHLSEAKRKEFVQGLKLEAESEIVDKLEKLRAMRAAGGIFKETIDDQLIESFQKSQKKKVRANYRGKNHTQYAEWVNDGMISAEILFRVTIFEGFLKHVHAVMLKADSKIFTSAKPKRQTTYDEVFSGPFDEFKEQQICREVEELDRQSMEQRLDYFAKHLGIDFDKKRKWLIELSDLRNKIAHGRPLDAITKDDTTIPLPGIQAAIGTIIRDGMKFTFDKGRQKHPHEFLTK